MLTISTSSESIKCVADIINVIKEVTDKFTDKN